MDIQYSKFSENYYGTITGLFTAMLFALVILLLWGIPTIADVLNRLF